MNRFELIAVGIAIVAACAPSQSQLEEGALTEKGDGGGGGDAAQTSSSRQASTSASVGGGHGVGGGHHAGGGETAPDCVMVNGMNIVCDPQDQTPCNQANGEACDTIYNQGQHVGFGCYPAPNTLTKDAQCPGQNGEFCRSGLTCYVATQTCKEFCCGDADCTLGGTCTYKQSDGMTPIFPLTPTLGLCL
ncbi:MAG TPA: hypothetical protein VFB62_19960 [Polyangiaceae bacterium]|jgi:hypothetical protein|nr:hypothetical protein [Polyangiaceae bacterium]